DLALWISGSPALKVSAYQRGDAPALVWAHIEAADGTLWSLRTSWLLPNQASFSDRLEVHGSDGAEVLKLTPAAHTAALGRDRPLLLVHQTRCSLGPRHPDRRGARDTNRGGDHLLGRRRRCPGRRLR